MSLVNGECLIYVKWYKTIKSKHTTELIIYFMTNEDFEYHILYIKKSRVKMFKFLHRAKFISLVKNWRTLFGLF